MKYRPHIVIDARIRRSSTGRYVDRLLEHLQDIDDFHRYSILVQTDDPWKPRAKNFHTVPCPYDQFSLNPLQQIGFAHQLYRLHPDLVHFGMTQQPLFYFGKIVTTTHDLTMLKFVRRGTTPALFYWLKIAAYKLMLIWSHFKSSKIIVPTHFVAEDVAKYQPSTRKKLVVTYEASEPPLKIAGRQPKQLKKADQFLLYVGTAFPHKNLANLVRAFEIIHEQKRTLKLVLVGKKEIHYEELEHKIAISPALNNIILTGFVSDAELKWLYEHCRAYVFPSLSEGFGLPGLEAMAHGAPVISSTASCLPEVYGDAAEYFDPNSVRDIATRITKVLDDKKLCTALIQRGTKQLRKYSWHKMAEGTLAVYKEVLEETNKKA